MSAILNENWTILLDVEVSPSTSVVDSLSVFLVAVARTTHFAISDGLVALSTLGFTLVVSLLIDELLSTSEIRFDLLGRR